MLRSRIWPQLKDFEASIQHGLSKSLYSNLSLALGWGQKLFAAWMCLATPLTQDRVELDSTPEPRSERNANHEGTIIWRATWLINNSTLTLTSRPVPVFERSTFEKPICLFSPARIHVLRTFRYTPHTALPADICCMRPHRRLEEMITYECHDNDMKDKSVYRNGRAHARSEQSAQHISSSEPLPQI